MKINYTFNKKKGEEIIETDEKFDDIIKRVVENTKIEDIIKGLLKIIKECKKI